MKQRALTALLALFPLIQACSSQEQALPPQREMLDIGVFGSQGTPRKAPDPAVRGVEMAVFEYNRNADSTYQFRVKKVTGEGSPEGAKTAADGLAKAQRLVGAVGPFTDGEAAAAAPVLEKGSIPFLTTAVTSAEVPQPEWRSFRRLVSSDRQQGTIMAKRTEGPIAIFHDGSPPGRAFADGAKEALDKAKRPIARFEKISGSTNLAVVSGNVAQQKPSAVIYGGDGGLGRALADALRKAAFKAPIVASYQVLQTKPSGLAEGILTGAAAADPADKAISEFKKRFRSRFSSGPGQFSVEAYEAAWMLLEAVEEVEPKPKVIGEFFRLNRSFLGDSKSYEYDQKGELKSPPLWIYESKGGGWHWQGRSKRAP